MMKILEARTVLYVVFGDTEPDNAAQKSASKDPEGRASRAEELEGSPSPKKTLPNRKDGPARGATKPEPAQILKFLLSPEAIDLCRPYDEIKELKSKDRSKLKTYSTSEFTPFEELVSAAILSRPISHALGVRSIRTIFNDPYNLTAPKALQGAGFDKRLQALQDARTQHKDKTATQLGLLPIQ
ncbi:MAG: hypothetical protein LQ340_007475 [Diploschistes diacapsis]|nr:MAG: hypothetical protein LQ340_007475 [Diploschistes diacapsis]